MISVRTMREFLDFVASLYEKARKPLRRSFDKRIVKGRAKCIASQTEEAFADFICKSILRKKPQYKVFVDYPITVKPGRDDKSKETRYIDFMLCKELQSDRRYEILYMAELKMNTGWMRKRVVECADDMASLRACLLQGKISARNGDENHDRVSFSINTAARYDLVIISGANTDLKNLRSDVCSINRRDEHTHAVILTNGEIVEGCRLNKTDKETLDCRMREAAFGRRLK